MKLKTSGGNMKITLFKQQRQKETINRLELSEVVRMVADGDYADEVYRLRSMYHLMRIHRQEDGSVETDFDGGIQLPRICFAAEYEHRNGERHLRSVSGLTVVEVNNLASYDEAIAVREAAKQVPQTMLCFLGASGRSVKIVCRGEQKDADAANETFHEQLYQLARRAYSAQLDLSIESLQPRLDRTVYISADPDLGWNEQAIPFYISPSQSPIPSGKATGATPSPLPSKSPLPLEGAGGRLLLPGRSGVRTYQLNYLFILESVLGTYFELPDEQRQGELLMRMASRCLEEGIPMGIAQAMTLEHPVFNSDEQLVRKTFQAVYTVEHLKEYQEKHKLRPLKSIPEDTLLMMKTEAFLNANFEMRKNVMTGVAQYRERSSDSHVFHDLDQEARNDMTIRAKELGLKSWDKDIDRFIDSTRIIKYDPVNTWLDQLPHWDGRDRITALAQRVPTNNPHWEQYFRTWLLGMVAHWMGRSTLTGNALIPLLIGRQGCGKSSFCRILLPTALRDYYNDRISFKNDTDLNLGLTSFALINIDEFDKVTLRQQVLLKYLLSTADVKFRPPYGKAMKQYRRYASFIGTTNDLKPLTDPTGSRRFVCCEVTGDIDFADNIEHEQLYAQLRQLVMEGERYWLDDEETAVLMNDNERFQRVNALEEMIAETFCRPVVNATGMEEQPLSLPKGGSRDATDGRWWTVGEIAACLQKRYRSQDTRSMTLRAIGHALNARRFGFESKRRAQGMVYWLAERLAVLLCVLTLSLSTANAAIEEETLSHKTLRNGLAGETVHRFITDHSGLLWIATNSGVNVFNGKQLKAFRMEDKSGRTLEVYDLCEVPGKYIYAATECGLYRLGYGDYDFQQVLPEVKQPTCLLAVGDTIYIGGQQGFLMYDGHRLTQRNIDVSGKGIENIVRKYVRGADGLIWFLGRFSLHCYHPKTGKISNFAFPSKDKHVLTQFAALGNGRFLIGTSGEGLFLYDKEKNTFQHVEGAGNIISTVDLCADGCVSVATNGAGAYLLNRETLAVEECFSTDGDERHRIPTNGVYCYYHDENGVNWFGFVHYGMAYTYHIGNLFKPFAIGDFTTLGMNVRTYCKHGNDMLISVHGGFYYVNMANGLSHYFSSEQLGGANILNVIAWYDGCFYIGSFDGGLYVFNPTTQTVSRQQLTPLLDAASIGDLKVGRDGRLYIGSSRGLMIVDKGQVQEHYTEQNSHIKGGLVLDITFDAAGNAWLTGEHGCSIYSCRSHEIVEPNYPEGFFNLQPWMRGAAGHNGMIFMRTGPQTFYTDSQMKDFGELKFPVSFHDKWCRNFIDDMNGFYLLTSERGIFQFDYALKKVSHFGYAEGLQGSSINDMGIDDNGLLWVATSQGLYLANRKEINAMKPREKYKVHVYNIRIGSDLMNSNEEYLTNELQDIRLTWNFTSEVLQMNPILLDYSKQSDRLYEYRIDGKEWLLVDGDEPIDIRGLLLGRHHLQIRLAGVEGTLSEFTLTVIPSVWAYMELLLFIIAVVLLWLWWRYRKNTQILLTERNEIEDALMEAVDTLELQELQEETPELLNASKYQKVKVDEQECADIVKRMEEYIKREKVYTDVDLKMKDLADVLHLSAPKLSQVFNLYLNEKYYDYINRYRLNEFKRLIEAGEYKRYTITALSERCGFKKSNFFSTFRKIEGMTPVEYLKKQGINA